TRRTTTSASSGTGASTWSRPRCPRARTTGTAGRRRRTSCSASSSPPGRSTARSSRSCSGVSAGRAKTTSRRVRPGAARGGKGREVVQRRIGGRRDDAIEQVKPGDIKVMHRALGAYLSRRDQVQQAIRMVETPDIEDENGVPFLIVYGISGNTHRFWSLASA